MKDNKYTFAMAISLLVLLVCGGMTAYFVFFAPKTEKLDLASIQKRLHRNQSTLDDQEEFPPPSGKSPAAGIVQKVAQESQSQPPAAKLPTAEFTSEKLKAEAPKADFDVNKARLKAVLPPAKLAPDMFAFETLPFDAPLAQFPLVLVWQKNLEWYKIPPGERQGFWMGNPGSSIYGKGQPPVTPPPGPPPGPPGPPPGPPPEVSTSGL